MEIVKITRILMGFRTLGQFIHGDTPQQTRDRCRVVYDALESHILPSHEALGTHIPAAQAILQGFICLSDHDQSDSTYVQAMIDMYVEVIDDCIQGVQELPF